ncbi:MAG: preprotein translocase subunit SecY [Candidatus Marinimicrobia bacterium]|jgi:preprotein translocase subunit SecY|nr:preprotein translocase subunit SecY [Candidatus Neomarinimicrobiota bacterium]|tara:strand:- start:646 stop:1959 length:1314 start_codon:yes stop_codon:yes gene_type:complete
MIEKIRTIFSIPDLRSKIFYTLSILIVVRVGAHIPIPGVDANALAGAFERLQDTLFGLFNMFVGGAFEKASLFSLGIMPYISSSIIIQLMGSVLPYFQRLQKEGEAGRKKITQITRYVTVLIATMQSYGVTVFLEKELQVVINPGALFVFTAVISMVTGTIFLMWMGERVTERGIGNGISIIIMVGIISRLPFVIGNEIRSVIAGEKLFISELVLMGIMFLVICFVVLLTQGTRKIPVNYAKRVVGRKVYGGQNTHIPLRVNTAGVMPIIFAQSIMFIPSTISTFFVDSDFSSSIMRWFSFEHPVYWIFFGLMIIFFTYFYTAIAFDPIQVSSQMKQQGGFIPGVRPGKKTVEYIDNILSKVTLPGSVALALVAIFPYILMQTMDVEYDLASFFGGTSLLIIVGVALDTLQQLESHLMMRHYDGFLTKGKIRGRRRM